MPYQFVNTTLSSSLTIPSVQEVDLEQTYEISLGKAPGSDVWTKLGKSVPKEKFVRIEFILSASTESAARTAWNQLVSYAKTASSIERTGSSFRAIQGIGASNFRYLGQLKRARCVLDLIPKFAYWTTSRAEDASAYSSASKTEF